MKPALRIALVLLASAASLSGCLQASPGEPVPSDSLEPLPVEGPWAWNLTGPTWGMAATLSAPNPGTCKMEHTANGESPRPRPVIASALVDLNATTLPHFYVPAVPTTTAWSRIEANGVSQDVATTTVDWEATGEWAFEIPAGRSQLLMAARDLMTTDDSANLTVSCPSGTMLLNAFTADEVFFFDLGDATGGAGFQESVFGGTGGGHAQGVVEWPPSAANSFLGVLVDGDLLGNHLAAGTVKVSHPNGTDEWMITPRQNFLDGTGGASDVNDRWRTYADGPGLYQVELTMASVQASSYIRGFGISWAILGES